MRMLQNCTMTPTLESLDRRVTALEAAQGETTQTLRWVVAKLGRIQAVQDEHTLRLERVEQRLDGVEQRLDRVEQRLDKVDQRLDKVEQRLERVQASLGSVEVKVDALPRAIAELVEASERRVMAAIAAR
jgi:chromosome segregation ATPase